MGYRHLCPSCNEAIFDSPTEVEILSGVYKCPNCSEDLRGFIDEYEKIEKVEAFLKRISDIEEALKQMNMKYI
jgi:transcription initiation factor IIE alpha subunit